LEIIWPGINTFLKMRNNVPKQGLLWGLKRKLKLGPKLRIKYPSKEFYPRGNKKPFKNQVGRFECLYPNPTFWSLNQGKKGRKEGGLISFKKAL